MISCCLVVTVAVHSFIGLALPPVRPLMPLIQLLCADTCLVTASPLLYKLLKLMLAGVMMHTDDDALDPESLELCWGELQLTIDQINSSQAGRQPGGKASR